MLGLLTNNCYLEGLNMLRKLLRNAVKSGNIQLVAECLQLKQAQENTFTYLDMLRTAAGLGYTNICQLLIAKCHILHCEKAKSAAMLAACLNGHLSTTRSIAENIPLNSGTPLYWTAMLHACSSGNYDIVGWLLDIATATTADRLRWWLVAAAGRGDINNVQVLAERICLHDVVVMSQALRIACYGSELDVVEYLLRYTAADVSRRGYVIHIGNLMTPLVVACTVGYVSMSMKLLQCVTTHAVKTDMNSTRNTLLHLAVWHHTTNSTALRLHYACDKGWGLMKFSKSRIAYSY